MTMPLYLYKCMTCGASAEVLLMNPDDDNGTMCLACWKPMRRQVSKAFVRGETVVKRQT